MTAITITDKGTGKVRSYAVRGIEALTLREWMDIVHPPEVPPASELDATIDLIHRWVKVPKPDLLRLSVGEMDRLVTALGNLIGKAAAFRIEGWKPPTTYEWAGVTYTIPQNIEAETTFGQWADLNAALEKLDNDADMLPVVMAHLLVEEGKDYDGSLTDAKAEAFKDCPIEVPIGLHSFFLGSGNRYKDAMSRFMNRRVSYALQLLQQGLTDLSAVTDGSARSSN